LLPLGRGERATADTPADDWGVVRHPCGLLRHDRDFFGLCGLLLPISFRCPQCFGLVALVADVVSLVHTPRLVARDAHGDGFRHASAHHVADGAASKVMEEPA